MSLPIVTAVSDPAWEAELAAALEAASGVDLVRRCVDLADLLAVATAGVGRAAVVSGDLRGLDGDAVARLQAAGVAVVGVAAAESATGARLRRLGITEVLGRDAAAADVVAALATALRTATNGASQRAWAHATSSAPVPDPAEPTPDDDPSGSAGTVIAVWGPAGASGRSVTALNLAAELADVGGSSLLVDADPYGGVAGQLLGLLDEAPGLAAACRLANQGTLDAAGLAALTVELRPRFRVLTGITRSARWPELRPNALDTVLGLARQLAGYVVVDVGFCLEQDEELAYDTVAPRRNGATLTALEAADTVLAVAAADPVGMARFVRGLPELVELRPSRPPQVVVNRLRPRVTGAGDPRREVRAALERYAGVRPVAVVPDDQAGFDAAMARGQTLAEAAPGSRARLELRELAARLAGVKPPRSRRRLSLYPSR